MPNDAPFNSTSIFFVASSPILEAQKPGSLSWRSMCVTSSLVCVLVAGGGGPNVLVVYDHQLNRVGSTGAITVPDVQMADIICDEEMSTVLIQTGTRGAPGSGSGMLRVNVSDPAAPTVSSYFTYAAEAGLDRASAAAAGNAFYYAIFWASPPKPVPLIRIDRTSFLPVAIANGGEENRVDIGADGKQANQLMYHAPTGFLYAVSRFSNNAPILCRHALP